MIHESEHKDDKLDTPPPDGHQRAAGKPYTVSHPALSITIKSTTKRWRRLRSYQWHEQDATFVNSVVPNPTTTSVPLNPNHIHYVWLYLLFIM